MPQPSDPTDPRAAEPDALEHLYELTSRCLGSGLNGGVMLASHRETREWVAVKTFSLEGLDRGRVRDMFREISVHRSLDHPNIAKATDAIIGAEQVHLVTEYLEGGDVLKHVLDQGKLGEQESRGLIKQVLQAIRHLHRMGIVHRDVKPENMGVESDSREKVKLIDFGLSRAWRAGDQKMHRICGTKAYLAPEVFKGFGYTNKVDMWSLGISVHVMLTGKEIGWTADSTPVLSRALGACSWNAQHFVAALISTDPAVRPSAAEASRHPWIRRADVGEELGRPPTAGAPEPAAHSRTSASRIGICVDANPAFARLCALNFRTSQSGDDIHEANASTRCLPSTSGFGLLRSASSAWAPAPGRLMRLLNSAICRTGATARREPATQVSEVSPAPSSSSPKGIAKVSASCSTDIDMSCPYKMSL